MLQQPPLGFYSVNSAAQRHAHYQDVQKSAQSLHINSF